MAKYWCDTCRLFVEDSKYGKSQHEATGRHRGGVQRQLGLLHRENQERAKEEKDAARLISQIRGSLPVNGATGVESTAKVKGFAIAKAKQPPNHAYSITQALDSNIEVADPTPEVPVKRKPLHSSKALPDRWIIKDKSLRAPGEIDVSELLGSTETKSKIKSEETKTEEIKTEETKSDERTKLEAHVKKESTDPIKQEVSDKSIHNIHESIQAPTTEPNDKRPAEPVEPPAKTSLFKKRRVKPSA